ncbi:MAG: RsmE family RNA methyltransferase [Bacillota bacterium]|nr:RsmE family RNA methyltransferase [Bacillota bacterium]
MNRFFVEPANVKEKNIIIDSKEDIKHLSKVLRLKKGDEIEVSDGCEWEYMAVISDVSDDAVIADITDKQAFAREPKLDVTLFQGIPKQTKMDSIVQKTVELGVKKIVPVFMDRTVAVDKGKTGKKVQRWQKIASESVKQCKRGVIPQVKEPVDFEQAAGSLGGYDLIVFPYENEKDRTIKDLLRNIDGADSPGNTAGAGVESSSDLPGTVAVIIGPEGGFSETEAEKIVAAGGQPVSLGKTILRTETAGPAALAMIMYELEL